MNRDRVCSPRSQMVHIGRRLCASLKFDYFSARASFQVVQVIAPLLHKKLAICQECRSVVCTSIRIFDLVCELMFKKINAREKLIGWYHSGPKLRASDLEINELFKRYTPNPLLVIIDVQPKEAGVPTDAYFAVEEIKDVRNAVAGLVVELC